MIPSSSRCHDRCWSKQALVYSRGSLEVTQASLTTDAGLSIGIVTVSFNYYYYQIESVRI